MLQDYRLIRDVRLRDESTRVSQKQQEARAAYRKDDRLQLYNESITKQLTDSSIAVVVREMNPTAGIPTIEGRDIEAKRL
jgi:hypothetical protein